MRYKEFVKIVEQRMNFNAWYDDTSIYAEELTESFSDKNWKDLSALAFKSEPYMRAHIAFVLGEPANNNEHAKNLLFGFLDDKDSGVLTEVFSALNSLDDLTPFREYPLKEKLEIALQIVTAAFPDMRSLDAVQFKKRVDNEPRITMSEVKEYKK